MGVISWLAAAVRGWHELPLLQSRNLIGLNFYGFWSHSPQPAALSLELSDAIFPVWPFTAGKPGGFEIEAGSEPSWEDANNEAAGCRTNRWGNGAKAQIIGLQ